MKILGLFLVNEIRTGGHTRYLELMEGLSKKGHQVSVFLNAFLEWKPKYFQDVRVSVPYIRGKDHFLGEKFKKYIQDFISVDRQIDADWIVVFGETNWPAADFLSKHFDVPVLFAFRSDTIQENLMYLAHEKLSLLKTAAILVSITYDFLREKRIAKGASLIVFQNNADQDRFISRNSKAADRCVVIRGDIRQDRFIPALALSNTSTECRNILFVGTLGKRKGLDYLLQALRLVSSRLSEGIHLDILASGTDYAPFQKKITEYGLDKLVTFHGKVSSPLNFMVRSDLLIVPSLFDSYPNVLLEALHVGLPVLGSRTGGIPDMLADDRLLFEPASAQGIAEKILLLAQNNNEYLNVRDLCRKRRSYFDFDWAAAWESAMLKSK